MPTGAHSHREAMLDICADMITSCTSKANFAARRDWLSMTVSLRMRKFYYGTNRAKVS
jgi:hypothetical protein